MPRLKINSIRKDMEFKSVVTEFIRHGRIKNLSERTLDYYEESIDVFTKFMKTDKFKIESVDSKTIDEYIMYLKTSGIRSRSINTRLSGIRTFLYWCMERGYMDSFKISLLKQEEIIKDTFNDDEIAILLKKPDIKKCSFTEYRNWVMINFLLGTGVRLSTLISIKVGDIDLYSYTFKTSHNKNRREQIIPVSPKLGRVLTEYLMHRQHENDDNVLFCNQYGGPLTTNACDTALQRYGSKRGISKCYCHKFRHTFAKNWILSGGDAFRLQKILGHSSMDIVRKYVNIYGNELQKDFNKFNVLERFNNEKNLISMN